MTQSSVSDGAYNHTQSGPWTWVLTVVGLSMCLAGSATISQSVPVGAILISVSALMVILGFCVSTLTVCDRGDTLQVRFGPVPLFRICIPYSTIHDPHISRSRVIDGWGIHCIPGRGWTYNIYGFDCVEFIRNGALTRIGTDDPEGVHQLLLQRISQSTDSQS